MLKRITTYFGFMLAKSLQPYLSRTPVIWGDPDRLDCGKGVVLVNSVLNLRSGNISIGDHSFLGHGVMLLTGAHSVKKKGISRQVEVQECGRDIVIGKGVWIASGCIVIGPCNIGDNSVIGAGCIISQDVPENSICKSATENNLVVTPIKFS